MFRGVRRDRRHKRVRCAAPPLRGGDLVVSRRRRRGGRDRAKGRHDHHPSATHGSMTGRHDACAAARSSAATPAPCSATRCTTARSTSDLRQGLRPRLASTACRSSDRLRDRVSSSGSFRSTTRAPPSFPENTCGKNLYTTTPTSSPSERKLVLEDSGGFFEPCRRYAPSPHTARAQPDAFTPEVSMTPRDVRSSSAIS